MGYLVGNGILVGTKFVKISKLCSKSGGGVNFTKEILLNDISENIKILLKLDKKF